MQQINLYENFATSWTSSNFIKFQTKNQLQDDLKEWNRLIYFPYSSRCSFFIYDSSCLPYPFQSEVFQLKEDHPSPRWAPVLPAWAAPFYGQLGQLLSSHTLIHTWAFFRSQQVLLSCLDVRQKTVLGQKQKTIRQGLFDFSLEDCQSLLNFYYAWYPPHFSSCIFLKMHLFSTFDSYSYWKLTIATGASNFTTIPQLKDHEVSFPMFLICSAIVYTFNYKIIPVKLLYFCRILYWNLKIQEMNPLWLYWNKRWEQWLDQNYNPKQMQLVESSTDCRDLKLKTEWHKKCGWC